MPNSYGKITWGGGEYAGPLSAPSGSLYFPTILVEVGFAANALDEPVGTWTDISYWAFQGKIKRGRQHELGRFDAGTLTLNLLNTDGRFSPSNSGSPYGAGAVAPGRPIRVRATYGAVTCNLFRGFIEAWKTSWSGPTMSTVQVTAVDAMKLLNAKKVSTVDYYQAVVLGAFSPAAYYKLGDATGTTAIADSSGNGRTLTIDTYGTSVFAALTYGAQQAGALTADTNTAYDFGRGEVLFSGAGPSYSMPHALTISAWVKLRSNIGTNPFLVVSQSTFRFAGELEFQLATDTNGNAVFTTSNLSSPAQITATSSAGIADDQWHHVVGTVDSAATTLTLYVDGIQVASAAGSAMTGSLAYIFVGGAPGVTNSVKGCDGLIDEVTVHGSALTAANVWTLYRAGVAPNEGMNTGNQIGVILDLLAWPAGLRNLQTGQSQAHGMTDQLLTGSALAYMQTLADTEGGQLFIDAAGKVNFFDRTQTSLSPYTTPQITLGDGAGEEPYLVDSVDPSFDDLDLYTDVTNSPADLGPQRATNATAVTRYGTRGLSRSTLHYSAQDALNQATFILNTHLLPIERVEQVTFTPMSDPAMLFPAALGLELLQRVKFVRRPMDGSGSTFSQESLVEGIEHSFSAERPVWQTTWRLSPTDAASRMGIFNQSTFNNALFGY